MSPTPLFPLQSITPPSIALHDNMQRDADPLLPKQIGLITSLHKYSTSELPVLMECKFVKVEFRILTLFSVISQ